MRNKVITFFEEGYGIKVKNPNPFLMQYNTGKEKLKKFLGNKTRIERDVDLVADDDYIEKKFKDIINEYKNLKNILQEITIKEIVNNKIGSKKLINGKSFQKGMRTSKVLASLVSGSPKKIYNDYSMLLQDIKVQGQLVITIELLEMMTASMNDNNWSSCLDLDNGTYRAGVYSYIMDN